MAQPPVGGPFRELDLAHELRLDPVRACDSGDARRLERGLGLLELGRSAAAAPREASTRTRCRPCPRSEPALGVVHAEEQRAEADARAFGIGVAADDELLALEALRLEPVFVRARLVGRVAALGHDPFHAHACRPGRRTRGRRRPRGRCSGAASRRAARRGGRSSSVLRSSRGARASVSVSRCTRSNTKYASPPWSAAVSAFCRAWKLVIPLGQHHGDLAVEERRAHGERFDGARPRWGTGPSSPCRCGSAAAPCRPRAGPGCGSRRTSSRAATRRPRAARPRGWPAAASTATGSGALRAPGTAAAAAARSRRGLAFG